MYISFPRTTCFWGIFVVGGDGSFLNGTRFGTAMLRRSVDNGVFLHFLSEWFGFFAVDGRTNGSSCLFRMVSEVFGDFCRRAPKCCPVAFLHFLIGDCWLWWWFCNGCTFSFNGILTCEWLSIDEEDNGDKGFGEWGFWSFVDDVESGLVLVSRNLSLGEHDGVECCLLGLNSSPLLLQTLGFFLDLFGAACSWSLPWSLNLTVFVISKPALRPTLSLTCFTICLA